MNTVEYNYSFPTHFYPAEETTYTLMSIPPGHLALFRFMARGFAKDPRPKSWNEFVRAVMGAVAEDITSYEVLNVSLTNMIRGDTVYVIDYYMSSLKASFTPIITDEATWMVDLVIRTRMDSGTISCTPSKWEHVVQEAFRGVTLPSVGSTIVNLVGTIFMPIPEVAGFCKTCVGPYTPELAGYYAAVAATWGMAEVVARVEKKPPDAQGKAQPPSVVVLEDYQDTDRYLGKSHMGFTYGFVDSDKPLLPLRVVSDSDKIPIGPDPSKPPGASSDVTNWLVLGGFAFLGYKLWNSFMGEDQ